MTSLADHPISKRWPATRPDAIQLYTAFTPNGLKIAAALEELGLDWELQYVSLGARDQHTPEFLALNPNNKIPAIVDPHGPGDAAMPLFESGAILLYLAEKTGRLLPHDPVGRWQTIQWLMWQMGGVGPMFGQVGYFVKNEGRAIEDPRPRTRYLDETRRLLSVLDRQLVGRDWIAGSLTIADFATAPWLRSLRDVYRAGDLAGLPEMPNASAYLDRFLALPPVERAIKVLRRD